MEIDAQGARDALESVRRGRAAAADRLVTPLWYHPILGLLEAMLVVAIGLGTPTMFAVAVTVFFLGIAALVTGYKALTGVWVSGIRAGGASWLAWLSGVVMAACLGGAAIVRNDHVGPTWLVWVLAALAFAAIVVIGPLFDRVVRRELRAEPR
jgi:hypothetical protein